MTKVKVSAPGKLILSGEHAVVYGKPAILATVDKRLFVTISQASRNKIITSESPALAKWARDFILKVLNSEKKRLKIEISSKIPVGCGMGSSAALAVALTAGLFKYLNKNFNQEKINELAYEIEKRQHGTPSGGDNTIVTHGGFLWYRKETEFLKLFQPLKFNLDQLPEFVFFNTGRPAETTGEMVNRVRKRYDCNRNQMEKILEEMEKVTKEILVALNQTDKEKLMRAIRKNEEFLEEMGVVSSSVKRLIAAINRIGGAAKICGAGGKKKKAGIIMALHPQKESLFEIAKKRNLVVFEAKLGGGGVRNEKN